jgi:hypothetical protein
MPKYRFYDLRPEGREVDDRVLYNDEVAIKLATSELYPAGCEVWQDGRLVGAFRRPAEPTD